MALVGCISTDRYCHRRLDKGSGSGRSWFCMDVGGAYKDQKYVEIKQGRVKIIKITVSCKQNMNGWKSSWLRCRASIPACKCRDLLLLRGYCSSTHEGTRLSEKIYVLWLLCHYSRRTLADP